MCWSCCLNGDTAWLQTNRITPRTVTLSGRSGVSVPFGDEICGPVQIGPAARPTSCTVCTLYLSRGEGAGALSWPPTPFSAVVVSPSEPAWHIESPITFYVYYVRVMSHTGMPSLCRRCISLLDEWSCSAAPVVFLRHISIELCFFKGRISCNWNEAWKWNCLWCKFGGKRSCETEKLFRVTAIAVGKVKSICMPWHLMRE